MKGRPARRAVVAVKWCGVLAGAALALLGLFLFRIDLERSHWDALDRVAHMLWIGWALMALGLSASMILREMDMRRAGYPWGEKERRSYRRSLVLIAAILLPCASLCLLGQGQLRMLALGALGLMLFVALGLILEKRRILYMNMRAKVSPGQKDGADADE